MREEDFAWMACQCPEAYIVIVGARRYGKIASGRRVVIAVTPGLHI
jgi:hypothetical protein